ncbi:hypothetical protein niasHT_040124 [Heterodera trifolii]|uniref:Uncharacterized protein n=1 Tax=Heterodera trifolii TaxID=157864 RepID=A0ABD2ICS6_9BILA
MAKRKLPRKLNCKKALKERKKREERKAQTKRATEARLAKKTAPEPNTDAEMAQPPEEEPSTSAATAEDNDGSLPATPTPMTPQEMDVSSMEMVDIDAPFSSIPADDDQQIQSMPSTSTARCDLVATPSTSKAADDFGLDDMHMFDELRRRHITTEEELQRQRRSNAFLRKQLKAQRDRSTSLERSSSACRQRKALSDVTNNQQGDSRLSAANDLLITLDSGITFKAREALKRSFAGHGHDIWAPTWAVKRLKRELVEGANFEWVSEGQTRALVCTDVRAMVEGRLQALAESGRLQLHQQFVSQIVLVLTGGDIYKILDHPKFASFTAPIPPGPLKFTLIDAMNDLRQIYHLSRAKILHPEGLNSLEHWTKMFYCHWQQLRSIDVARYPVRPKLHLLTAHVVPFARSHLWWGLISDQGMEHMHRMCNNLVGRYSHLGTQEKVVEKLVKHTTMLNALHDRGVEDKKENDKYPDF